MKKLVAVILTLVLALSVAACAAPAAEEPATTEGTEAPATTEGTEATTEGTEAPAIKVGFIMLHDENSTYDLNFINAAKEACATLGIPEENYVIKTNVPEGQECYNTAAELADAGCNIIFADSFGHEDYMIQAAKEFPEVQFCHSTGTKAHTEGLANYHNAFAATYAEVISGYTSFFLGARSVCPTATMEVTFTGSWYDETAEKEGAQKLIQNGCKLISQHADSMGAPTACETAGVPDVSYNGSTQDACPNTYIISSRIDWAPYYEYAITACMNGEAIDADWTGTLATGSVKLTDLNTNVAAEGTQEALDAAIAKLESGELKVFDCATFTVEGKTLDSCMADVDTDADYTPDTEVIENGAFMESKFRSAPYFQLNIDGITLLDQKF